MTFLVLWSLVWYLRMGHLPVHLLKHVKELHTAEIGILDNISQICPKAKLTRHHFPSSNSKTSHAFDLIHIDIWGPYKNPTYNNYRFFFTVIDDFTRMTRVFLMQSKSQAVKILENFVLHVQTQFGTVVKIIRSDNALEFC